MITPLSYTDSEKGLFAVNSFVATNQHSTPPVDAIEINCLNLLLPVVEENDPNQPELKSYNQPPEYSGKTIDRIVTVPKKKKHLFYSSP